MDDKKLALQMWEKALDFLDKRFPRDWGGCAVMYTEEGKIPHQRGIGILQWLCGAVHGNRRNV